MFRSTVSRLRCPACGSSLELRATGAAAELEVRSGELACAGCAGRYPILAGVALLVEDPRGYLIEHAKGIAPLVRDEELPPAWRREFKAARRELAETEGAEHLEEDLEAERVVSLYLMNHFLRVRETAPDAAWWRPAIGAASPLIDALVREHWDRGPLARIAEWIGEEGGAPAVIELGCGVGGLGRALGAGVGAYLGFDSSFASVALGRHVAFGVPYAGRILVPGDLLRGPVSLAPPLPAPMAGDGRADLVVGDLERAPAARGEWDFAVTLNTLDMLPEPEVLPRLQAELLAAGGRAIQCCPYIWHGQVASALRERFPAEGDSATLAERLYAEAGLTVNRRLDHLPWLFLKHHRQLEVYSVHLFEALRA